MSRRTRRPYTQIVGSRFGRWEALAVAGKGKLKCRCDCGTEREVHGCSLTTGKSVSCGCVWREAMKKVHATHGLGKHPSYRTWKNIKGRCHNKNNPEYVNYGGRGIKVCDRWRNDFLAFYEDFGRSKPEGRFSIDRIDNDGDYEPGNVRWATDELQVFNRRVTHKIEHDGVLKSASYWARHFDVPVETFCWWIRKYGSARAVELAKERSQEGV